MGRAAVEFVTRADCPLCDEAAARLRRWAPRLGIDVAWRDVDGDPALLAEFGGRVPVVRSAAGAVLVEGRFGARQLWSALLQARRESQ